MPMAFLPVLGLVASAVVSSALAPKAPKAPKPAPTPQAPAPAPLPAAPVTPTPEPVISPEDSIKATQAEQARRKRAAASTDQSLLGQVANNGSINGKSLLGD